MTGPEVIIKISKYLEDRIKLNMTRYVDLGNDEHFHRSMEDKDLMLFIKELKEGKNGTNNA